MNEAIIDERYTPERTNGVTMCCKKCRETKPIVEFCKASSSKSGYSSSRCLVCSRIENKQRYDNLTDEQRRARRETLRKWQDKNREYVNARARHFRNGEEVPLKGRHIKYKSYEEVREAQDNYYDSKKEHFHEYNRKRNQRLDVKAKRAAYAKKRINTNLQERIRHSLARRIRIAVKDNPKAASTIKLIGCPLELFKSWIEHQFWNGMSWDNYGRHGWHFDHIVPCAAFDLTKPEEQYKCFHWTNLQPLWAKMNASKKDDILPISDYQI